MTRLNRRTDEGYTLIELLTAVWIFGLMAIICLPDFAHLYDRAQMQTTVSRVVSDLLLEQIRAQELQRFQEVRFAPFGHAYELYDPRAGIYSEVPFAGRTSYFEGYLHLREATVRFDNSGAVSECGQVGLCDPEGDVLDAVIYLQFGAIRVVSHMIA